MSLNRMTEDIQLWVEDLLRQGIDLKTNAHRKLLHEALEYSEDPSIEEAADVFISLVASLVQEGYTGIDLSVAVSAKMGINRMRTWAQTADGTWQHVAEEVQIEHVGGCNEKCAGDSHWLLAGNGGNRE